MPSARHIRWAKFRVLTVCAAAVVILSILAYLLTGGSLLTERATMYLYIPDATGLGPGAPVRVDGIGVGKVRSVALSGSSQPNRVVKVTMTVERGRLASIPDDSTAQIASETMIGDKFVDISSGTSRHFVSPGGEIAFKGSPDLLKTLDIRQFEKQLKVVSALLDDIEQGRSDLGQFVMGDQMYSDLRKRFAQIESGIRAAASTTSNVGRELHTDQLYQQISQPLMELDRSLARLQSGQGDRGPASPRQRAVREAAERYGGPAALDRGSSRGGVHAVGQSVRRLEPPGAVADRERRCVQPRPGDDDYAGIRQPQRLRA